MIKPKMYVCALVCVFVSGSVCTAANVNLSLNLDFDTPGDLNSGGSWLAVATTDENGLTAIAFLADNIKNDVTSAPANLFQVFLSGQFGTVIEVVTGFDDSGLSNPIFGVGVPGSSFPSSYVDPIGIAPLAGNPDLGSFTGGVELATGTFNPGDIPALLESSGTLLAGANVFDVSGVAISADTLNLTVRTVVPEPTTILLFGLGLMGTAMIHRR